MKSLDALCESLFPADAPGAAIGVLLPEGFRYARGFGLANLETKSAFTPQTSFRACSISKQFVGLLVRQLEREGRLDLDSHPSRYVPSLAGFADNLSLRHLSQNRSGLPDYWCAAMLMGAKAESSFSLEQGAGLIRALAEPMFSPGSQNSYSNGNWRLLEWIIESVTGRALPELLAERVFAPLGMSGSGWGCDTSLALEGNPRGYRRHNSRWEEEITRACWSGDAALTSTLDDLLAWEAAMLYPDTGTLPCAGTLAEALPHANGDPGCYAYGINAWSRDGRSMHWHSGALRGWRMVQMRFPQDRASIVVMINRTENPSPYAMKIAECIGVDTTWDVVTAQPAPAAHRIGGVYYSTALGLLAEIRDEDDQVTLELGSDAVPLLWTGGRTLANAAGFYRVEQQESAIEIHARQFGWRDSFARLPFRDDRMRLAGKRFRCALLKSTVTVSADGASVRIHGPCGESDDYPLRALAESFVAFDCLRALDELPPGRFTVLLGADGRSIEIGCFLARRFIFTAD